RDRGHDLLVLDQRSRHVAEQRGAMGRGTLKLTTAVLMAHGYFLSVRSGAVSRNPRPGSAWGGCLLTLVMAAAAKPRRQSEPLAPLAGPGDQPGISNANPGRRAQPIISCSSFLAISSMFSGGQPGISMPRRR